MLVPDSIQMADHVVHDAWYHAPQHWTATGVLAKSSNVGTLMIAKNLVGPAQFYDTERKFGIGHEDRHRAAGGERRDPAARRTPGPARRSATCRSARGCR